MQKCPECNKNTRQFKATHIGDTVKRYNLCKNCNKIFIEVLNSPLGYNGELVDIKVVDLNKKKEKRCSFQSTLI